MILFQMDITDEARAAASAFQHDLSGMKQFQFGTVPDADQRRMIRFPDQNSMSSFWLRGSNAAVASSSTMMSGS